jgi:hypothetical protein
VKSSLRTSAYLLGELAAFATLLFVVRFILRGHLVARGDEECNLGGVAVDLLAHGVRFALPVYAPNEYENGFFYSGLLTATSFSLLGRNVLALKMPTHLIVSMGAVATLWLLRRCLDELRLSAHQVRWTAISALIVATAFSPREIAFYSTYAVGIGSHPEGAAIDMVLLAWFARRRAEWSAPRTAAFWVLLGLALHVNKGTLVLVLVLAAAELNLARSSPRRLIAVVLGFLLGSVPELVRMASAEAAIEGMGGWGTIRSKLMLHSRDFPWAFFSSVLNLADHRPELLATWFLAIALALGLLLRVPHRHSSIRENASAPSALSLTLGLLLLHVAALTVVAQGGLDYFVVHTYPPLVVLTALLAGWLCSMASKSWGVHGTWAGAMVVALTVAVYRPDTLRPGFEQVSALWGDRGGAVCSWRFGEAFLRVQGEVVNYAPSLGSPDLPERDKQALRKREQRAIERCRSLSETAQILDCIGGVARELQFGMSGRVDGGPPPELSGVERRAYAFYYGVGTRGKTTRCDDFLELALSKDCRTAVQMECFIYADMATRFASGHSLGRPSCDIAVPPVDGYWTEMRADLFSRPPGSGPTVPPEFSDESMGTCKALVEACY